MKPYFCWKAHFICSLFFYRRWAATWTSVLCFTLTGSFRKRSWLIWKPSGSSLTITWRRTICKNSGSFWPKAPKERTAGGSELLSCFCCISVVEWCDQCDQIEWFFTLWTGSVNSVFDVGILWESVISVRIGVFGEYFFFTYSLLWTVDSNCQFQWRGWFSETVREAFVSWWDKTKKFHQLMTKVWRPLANWRALFVLPGEIYITFRNFPYPGRLFILFSLVQKCSVLNVLEIVIAVCFDWLISWWCWIAL